MKCIITEQSVKTITTINGILINKVIDKSADLAHEVLIELSTYRQTHDIDEPFECERLCCEYLDMIGD